MSRTVMLLVFLTSLLSSCANIVVDPIVGNVMGKTYKVEAKTKAADPLKYFEEGIRNKGRILIFYFDEVVNNGKNSKLFKFGYGEKKWRTGIMEEYHSMNITAEFNGDIFSAVMFAQTGPRLGHRSELRELVSGIPAEITFAGSVE